LRTDGSHVRDSKGDGKYEITVSYRSDTNKNIFVTRIGWGNSKSDALEDADGQLPNGTWIRVAVSSPRSIFMDLQSRTIRTRKRAGEGVRILVEKRITRF
jgi:hypothetical protein